MGITRITSSIIFNNFLRNVQRSNANLIKAQEEIASGSDMQRPSDDPATANRILTLRTNVQQMKQFLSNTHHADAQLQAADAVLREVEDVILRASDLVALGVNDSTNQADRDSLAAELNQLIESILDDANASFGDITLFSGNYTDSPAYEAVRQEGNEITSVNYIGDDGTQRERVGANNWIRRNVPGREIFESGDLSLFDVAIRLRDALRRGSIKEAKSLVSELEGYHKHIADTQTDIGGRLQRLEVVDRRLTNDLDATQNLLSQIEEMDMTKVISDFRFQETVYAAVLSAGARTLGLSLFNFL